MQCPHQTKVTGGGLEGGEVGEEEEEAASTELGGTPPLGGGGTAQLQNVLGKRGLADRLPGR